MGRTGGRIADIGLPILGAIIGAPGGPAGMAAGASLGSGGASAIRGRPLGKSLKRAAITGGTTFAGGHLAGAGGAGGAGGATGGTPEALTAGSLGPLQGGNTGSVGSFDVGGLPTGANFTPNPATQSASGFNPEFLQSRSPRGFDLSPRLLQDGNILNPSGRRPNPPTREATKFGLNEASQVANITGGLQNLTQPFTQDQQQPPARPQSFPSQPFLPPPIPPRAPVGVVGQNVFDSRAFFGRR